MVSQTLKYVCVEHRDRPVSRPLRGQGLLPAQRAWRSNRSGTSPGENILQSLHNGNDFINDENSAQIMPRPFSHLYPERFLKYLSLLWASNLVGFYT